MHRKKLSKIFAVFREYMFVVNRELTRPRENNIRHCSLFSELYLNPNGYAVILSARQIKDNNEFMVEHIREKLRVFMDTNIINRIADLDVEKHDDSTYEEDRVYLKKILDMQLKKPSKIELYVNPSVRMEIENTIDQKRKDALRKVFSEFSFMDFNLTIFPFVFPVTFLSKGQKERIREVCRLFPSLEKDAKIIADSSFSKNIDVLLTTDRGIDGERLAKAGMDTKVFTPRALIEYLEPQTPKILGNLSFCCES